MADDPKDGTNTVVSFECPRRREVPRHMRVTLPPDHWRADSTCSWCGSLSPTKFFEAVDAGCQIGPTDKTYKAYVDLPNPDAGKIVEIGRRSGAAFDMDGQPTRDDLTDEEKAAGRYNRPITGEADPHIHAKFYFQHLSQADRDRFIKLHNADKMNIGFPGHFYTMPFFCRPMPESNTTK